MDTYYIRHTKDLLISDELRSRLWDERRVAVHYPALAGQDLEEWPDARSLDRNAYDTSGKRAVGALVRLAREGGYVCAEYAWRDACLIGFVPPSSKVELIEGRWRDRERTAVLKTLLLERTATVSPAKQTALLAGRPRQGTAMRWWAVGTAVADLVEGRESPASLGLLSPSLQESLCAEYLRTPEAEADGLPRLSALVLPVGRTLRDVDVYGVAADGCLLLAQVTLSQEHAVEWKAEALRRYAGSDAHTVLFCQCDAPSVTSGVMIYPIGRAFERFTATDAGMLWLDAALLRGIFRL